MQTGEGAFSLTDHSLTYRVLTPLPFTSAEVRGPGIDGPIIFPLDLRGCQAPGPGFPGECVFLRTGAGAITLTDDQVEQLVGQQWHVLAYSESRNIEGQILLVPEPPVVSIVCMAAATLWVLGRRKRFGFQSAPHRVNGRS